MRPARPAGGFGGTDGALIAAACEASNGDAFRRLYDGDTSGNGGDDSAADLALCSRLAFWTGCDAARIDRIFRTSGLMRDKWLRDDYRERTIAKAIEGCTETYGGGSSGNGEAERGESHDEPPEVVLGPDEHRVIDEVIEHLSDDPSLFRRGSMLARVVRVDEGGRKVRRSRGTPTITSVPPANLRERATRRVALLKETKKDGLVPAHPPGWLASGIEARGHWPGLRHLIGISDAPVLRPDGSVCQTPGYDEETGVLFDPSIDYPAISKSPILDDARAAADTLFSVVCDFPFESPAHRAAWLAGLLTPLARSAFDGPSPLFLIDANVRGAGKGLLAQTIGRIVLGRDMPVSSYAHEPEEMRKKITTIAIAGDGVVLLDNLEGRFGNEALDRALTSTRWKDRVLGKNDQVDLPLLTTWYATGNNVSVGADTIRRVIHVRLDVLEEKPEERSGFAHPDLLPWVTSRRGELMAAALTILSAYCKAGRPGMDLSPFGSFEGWSDLPRSAVAWVGQPDPCETRDQLAETADTGQEALGLLIGAWRAYDPDNDGIVIAELLPVLYPTRGEPPNDEASVSMRAALEGLAGGRAGRAPAARQLGANLKKYRRRVAGDVFLDNDPKRKRAGGSVWRLRDRRTQAWV